MSDADLVILYEGSNFFLFRPRSFLEILLRQLRECILIQVQDLKGDSFIDHTLEIDQKLFNLQ